jgi:dihydrofolate synthase/folylpolyglutamate synthase
LDHEQWLGHHVEQIAAEKAGIIKPRVPIITGTSAGPALEVIRATAEMKDALFIGLENGKGGHESILTELPLLGTHQRENARLALTVVSTLSNLIPVSHEALLRGIRGVHWPGRLHLLRRGSSQILLDGAHNPDGAKTLASAIAQHFAGQRLTLVLGLFRDKAWQEMCDLLVPLAHRLLIVPVSSERTAGAAMVQAYCLDKWPSIEITSCRDLADAIYKSEHDAFVIIAGSLHLIGEAMELLHVSPAARSERSLNEWDAANSAGR